MSAMAIWTAEGDLETDGYQHRFRGGLGHALFGSIASATFAELGVSASLTTAGKWWSIHAQASLTNFELAYHHDAARWAYNDRMLAETSRTRRTLSGEHVGLYDIFSPVVLGREVAATLVVGPFCRRRVRREEVAERWRALTSREADLGDPEFAAYVEMTRSTLVLEGDRAAQLEEMLTLFARLLAGAGRADKLMNGIDRLRVLLLPARRAERNWSAAREMLGETSARRHFSAAAHFDLVKLGLSDPPDQVLVGLAEARSASTDPIEELLRRDALQRASVELAYQTGDVLAGQLGNHGVVFLAAHGRTSKGEKKLLRLSRRVAALASDQWSLTVHFGLSDALEDIPLAVRYPLALGAAEAAFAKRVPFLRLRPNPQLDPDGFRRMREQLVQVTLERPADLPLRFDSYLAAVATRSGFSPETSRLELALCFERVADELALSSTLDAKTFSTMRRTLEQRTTDARSTHEVLSAYRSVMQDISNALCRPVPARQDRHLYSAIDYIRRNLAGPLTLKRVSRVAGFAPTYFSELFAKKQQTTFERYLFSLRLDRAKQLLSGTELSATRIAELSGFRTPQHLCHVFRRKLGKTPVEFRASKRTWTRAATKTNRTRDKASSVPAR